MNPYAHKPCHCHSKVESTSVALNGSNFEITIIPLQMFKNYGEYDLHLCVAFPEHVGTEPVSITDGTNTYSVMDTNGQPVVSGKLRGHKIYHMTYGSGGTLATGTVPMHFVIRRGLCPVEYSEIPALQAPPQI